jgi:hypothetical protein
MSTSFPASELSDNAILKGQPWKASFALVATWPVLAAAVVGTLGDYARAVEPAWRGFGSAVVFATLVVLCPVTRSWAVKALFSRSAALQVAIGAVGFAFALLVVMRWPPVRPTESLQILAGAASEELVFRWWLPVALAVLIGRKAQRAEWLVAVVVVAQVAFAFAHFAAEPTGRQPLAESARLAAAGLLYANVVNAFGVGVAVAIHAALNFTLLFTLGFHFQTVPFAWSMAFAVLGCALLWRDAARQQGNYPRWTSGIA